MFVERFFVELVDGFIVVEVNWRVDQIVHKPIGCVSEHDRDGCLFGFMQAESALTSIR